MLVCTHGKRDNRCGRIGPQVMNKLREVLKARGIAEEDVAIRCPDNSAAP